jgi:hypothetical protein
MAMSFAGALAGIAVILSVVSIVALAVSALEFPRRIRTFAGGSAAEREFDQRAKRWQMSGFTTLSLAAAVAVIAGFVAMR